MNQILLETFRNVFLYTIKAEWVIIKFKFYDK